MFSEISRSRKPRQRVAPVDRDAPRRRARRRCRRIRPDHAGADDRQALRQVPISRISSESWTRGCSNGNSAGRTGDEPVAMRIFSPRSTCHGRNAHGVGIDETGRAVKCLDADRRAVAASRRRRSCATTCFSWCMKSATVASRRSERSTPKSRRERQPERASAVSRKVLLGIVPVLIPAPPTSRVFPRERRACQKSPPHSLR